MSLYTMAFMGTIPFGSLLAGSLADSIGAPRTLLIGGVCCIIGTIVFSRRLNIFGREIHTSCLNKDTVPEYENCV